MKSFAARVLESGVATLPLLEDALETQLLVGGDPCTTLLERGVEEPRLLALVAEHFGLEAGPAGRLPPAAQELIEAVPADVAKAWHVYPLGRGRRHVRVAVSRQLDGAAAERLADRLGLDVRVVLVSELRLAEALHRYAGVPLSDRERELLAALDGEKLDKEVQTPRSASYRRMSERPDGIVPSQRQRKTTRDLTATRPAAETTPPSQPWTSPPAFPSFGPPRQGPSEPAPPLPHGPSSVPPPARPDLRGGGVSPRVAEEQSAPAGVPLAFVSRSEAVTEPPPATDPWDDERADHGPGRKRRTTDPWRDSDPPEGEPAMSVRTAFHVELSETPHAGTPLVFRHRGPLAFEQAELATEEADDVETVLQVLLRFARQYFERAMLLVVHGDVAECRGIYGMKPALATLRIMLSGPSLLRRAFRGGEPVIGHFSSEGVDALLASQLGLGDVSVGILPVQIRGRVVAMIYGDDGEGSVDPAAVRDVAAFTEIAATAIARLILRRKKS